MVSLSNHGVEHPVLKLIIERALSRSQPGQRRDECKLGLVIEGGAMRGVVSAGMVAGLESLGLKRVFDVVYGASAGAFNGAYFLAGQAALGTTIYYENLNSKNFINFWRLFQGKPVVNLAYVMEKVLGEEKPLHWESVLKSPIPLKIVVSSLKLLKPLLLSGFQNKEELFRALYATAKMPLLTGGPMEIEGDRFLDAGLFQGIPVWAALEDGCTHILILLTRPKGKRKKKTSIWDKYLFARLINRWRKGLGDCYLHMPDAYNECLSFIHQREKEQERGPFLVSLSLPADYPPLSRVEKNAELLRRAAAESQNLVCRILRNRVN
ncbi:MAG: patatin-like phospholipase family protein [Thermodesulfobacteriota bacterium]